MTSAGRAELVREALGQAEDLRRAGERAEAIRLLLSALRHGHDKAQILFRLGNLYFEEGDLIRAEHAYRRATEEDPSHPSAHHNLGVVYRRQGKIGQSVRLLKKAQRLEVLRPRRPGAQAGPKRLSPWWRRRPVAALMGGVVLVLAVFALIRALT